MENEKPTIQEKISELAERVKDPTKARDIDFANDMAQQLSSILWEAKLAYSSNSKVKHLFEEQRLFTSAHSRNPGILLNNVRGSISQLLSIIHE